MSDFEPAVTAFMLLKTNRAWLELTVPQRVAAFRENVLPAVEDWIWEARSHESFQLGVENAYAKNYDSDIPATVNA